MARIFRTSDRIPVKIGDLSIIVSPLSFAQKTELQTIMLSAANDPMRAVKGAAMAIRFAVKGVTGVETMDGEPWTPTFDADGLLSEESCDELLNLEENPKLIALCTQLVAGVPVNGVLDPHTRKPMDGITLELPKVKKAKAR